ncbi:hypothetical protein LSAT2_019242 [Lamellibrachia satsuma]|nr:hypothetical protein LSAT2_019242 [Lamellibrachia satsuma]
MPTVAVAVVAALAFMSVVHSSLAGTTRANIKLVNNGYEGILIVIAETVPVSKSETMINRIKVGTLALSRFFKGIRHDRELRPIYRSMSLAATSCVVRYSSDIKVLRRSFENALQLGECDVISGKLNSPVDAYEHETFVIRFPAAYGNKTLFFGLKVNHPALRISAVSNVVSALVYVQTATTTTTAAPEVKTTSNNNSSGTSIFVAIGGAAILLILIVILGVCNSFCSGKCGCRN